MYPTKERWLALPTFIVTPTFDFTELEENPFNLHKPVSDNYQLTIARLMGFDEPTGIFRLIRVGSDGRILTSTDAVKVNTGNISRVSVGIAATLLLSSNTLRKSFTIFNAGTVPLYIGFNNGVTTVNGFPISPGTYFSDDSYTGNIYGIYTIGGQDSTPVMEL